MKFIWPTMLVFLALLPLGVWWYRHQGQRRQRQAAQLGSLGFVQASTGKRLGKRRHIPPLLFLLGLASLVVALARPEAAINLPRIEGTVILAFDVSGSMAATDLQPTRMDAAKAVAREFVQRQPPTVQIGVVAFSDGGFAIQPPSNDQKQILAAIDRITPQRGTSIGQGILASLKTIRSDVDPMPRRYSTLEPTVQPQRQATSAAIVLLTDGENTGPPDPNDAAEAAAKLGVRVYPIGIGSTTGTTLDVNGFSVFTQLDETALQQIAELTNGAYFSAERQDQLRTIYDKLNLQLVIKPEDMELTALFAGLGLLLLITGAACSLLWFGRVP